MPFNQVPTWHYIKTIVLHASLQTITRTSIYLATFDVNTCYLSWGQAALIVISSSLKSQLSKHISDVLWNPLLGSSFITYDLLRIGTNDPT